tara:strand:- start:30839 stop:31192 length:354 start_codon:yes stop_codon:yes gene_type:complete
MKHKEVFERPWGRFIIVHEEPTYKLKKIEVNPGHRLSYQFHNKRSESWTIVKGSGEIILDGEKRSIKYGDCIQINKKSKHRISNNSDSLLIFIEVQTGTYFGEDDIVRIEDDYLRET